MFKIKMLEVATEKSFIVFQKTPDLATAKNIVESLNHLNSEAARFSGKAIRFVYSVVMPK